MRRVRECYADFGPTLAAEHLAQEDLRVSRETLRKWMASASSWYCNGVVQKEQERGALRRRFKERQMQDSSCLSLVGERGPACQLIAVIDDATSRFYARFTEHMA